MPGSGAASHTEGHRKQHEAFLAEVVEDSACHDEWVSWFRTIPMWLDLGELRIVHACWDPASFGVLGSDLLSRGS